MLRVSPLVLFAISAMAGAAALGGCGAPERGFGTGASVRDSAGVSIVRNAEPLWPADSGWLVADTPLVAIGAGNGTRIGSVVGVVRTAAGVIAVADGDAQLIRVYDLSGRLLRTLGRRGTGAGEFQAIDWIAAAGDSILAFDIVSRRLTTFGASSRARSAAIRSAEGSITAPLARFADGSLLIASGDPTFPFGGAEGSVRHDSALLLLAASDGAVLDTIARVGWAESFGVPIGAGDRRFLAPMPRPFGRRTSAIVSNDEVVVGEGERNELAVYGADGALRRSIRRERDPLPVTPEAIAAFKEAQRRTATTRGLQAQVDAALLGVLDSAPYPTRLPAYDRVLADAEGNLWVLDYSVRRDQPGKWNVFTAEGRWLGTVTTPARFRVEQAGSDWLLGAWRDPEGNEQVRMYPIIKP